jgi:hypothetical protein
LEWKASQIGNLMEKYPIKSAQQTHLQQRKSCNRKKDQHSEIIAAQNNQRKWRTTPAIDETRMNGLVTYEPRRMPRHQRAQAHNSTLNRRQHSFM